MKTLLMWFFVWVIALPAGSVYAKDRDQGILLRGTVGADAVVMTLERDGDRIGGHYFYEKNKLDINLTGGVTPNGYQLNGYQFNRYQPNGIDHISYFALTKDGDSFKGTFTLDEKIVPVVLRVVDANALPNPLPNLDFGKALSGYEKLKMADVQFNPGKTETVRGRYTIQWFTEPRSKIATFRVTGGYPEPAMSAINQVIDTEAYGRVLVYFLCSEGDKSGVDTDRITGYYLSDRFVSYRGFRSWFCGTQPDFGTSGTTIDARTGKYLTLEDVYWLGTGDKPKQDSKAWLKYRSKVFEPKVTKLLQKLYPEQMEEHGCEEPFKDGLWYFTAKGLYIGYCRQEVYSDSDRSFPDWSVIPWRILKKNNPDLDGK